MATPGGNAIGAIVPAQAPAALTPLGDPRQQSLGRLLQDVVGQQVPVQVLTRLADNSFIVRVAGQDARMTLPPGALPGSVLPMTVIEALPHPTFQLDPAKLPGAQALAQAQADAQPQAQAGMPGQAPIRVLAQALPRGVAAAYATAQAGAGEVQAPAPAAAPDGEHTTLSPTARVLSGILAAAANAAPRAAMISAAAPLAPNAQINPEPLARALDRAIQDSGLFYESHLAEWQAGQRSLDALAREPQMRMAAAPERSATPAAAGQQAGETTRAELVNNQLNLLERPQLSWQGQLLPGQPMHWTIEKDPPREDTAQGQGTAGGEPPWRSTLQLRFPHLGDIAASLTLFGGQLHVRIEAGDEESRARLQADAPALGEALGAAGATLAALRIGKPGP